MRFRLSVYATEQTCQGGAARALRNDMGGSLRLPLSLPALAILAALSGCQTGRPYENDPLVGGSPIARQPARGVSRPPEPSARAAGEVPPIPPATSTTSPAALTVGAIAPSGDRRTPAESVTLHGPRSKDGRGSSLAVSEASKTPARSTYEALQLQLQARGVVWQQLKMVEKDRWDFICAIPDPRQPNVRRNYEARARPSAVEAMREVLEEIDHERR